MNKIRVGVLRGGPSNEYTVSLKSGAAVLKYLPQEKYVPVDIFIDKDRVWHTGGVPLQLKDLSHTIDIAFNTLHGEYGEDGRVQQVLESVHIPYTGSQVTASAIAWHKELAKGKFTEHGIKTPYHISIDLTDGGTAAIREAFRSIPHPVIVKPVSGGSSLGISLAYDYQSLHEGVEKASLISPYILIESYIPGREATCGVIENFREEPLYALLPIEIIPPDEKSFFDYDAKYTGITQELCPGRFSSEETREIQDLAMKAHIAVGARHYSRSDFIVTPRGIYILEINSAAGVGLTEESLLPKSLDAIGSSLPQFLDHVVEQVLANHNII